MTSWENKVSRKFPNVTTSTQHKYSLVRCLHYCSITEWAWGVLTTNWVIYRKNIAMDAQEIWITSIYVLKKKKLFSTKPSKFIYLSHIENYQNLSEPKLNVKVTLAKDNMHIKRNDAYQGLSCIMISLTHTLYEHYRNGLKIQGDEEHNVNSNDRCTCFWVWIE